MIISRWGLVGAMRWEPKDYATDVLQRCYEVYIEGGTLSSDTGLVYMENGILKASFGRRQGHSHSIHQFTENHPEMEFCVVKNTFDQVYMGRREHGHNNVRWASLSRLDNLRGCRPDAVFFDVCQRDYMAQQQEIRNHIGPFRAMGIPVIVLISDAVDPRSVGPTVIEAQAPKNVLDRLGYRYEIAKDRRKTTSQ
jgi:hypothetical protein